MHVECQFTAFLENKPGRLHDVCLALAKEKISIQALTVTDSKDQSALRFVVDKTQKCREVLKKLGTRFSEAEVLVVELKHQPGALAHLCERLAAEHVNIDYMYCSAGAKNGRTVAILKATPLKKVQNVLSETSPIKTRGPMRRPPARK